MLVTDAHESSSLRFGRSREALRFPFYVFRPTIRELFRFSIFPDGLLLHFPGRFFLHVFYCVGALAVCTGVFLGIILARFFHTP